MEVSELESRSEVATEASASSVSRLPFALLATSLGILGVLYVGTFHSIVSIWSRSDTYMHGFLILPISLYLVWEKRTELRGIGLRPEGRAVVPLMALGAGWLAFRLAGVQVLEQYFVVAMIPLVVWAILGSELISRLVFPLGFLLLGVPVGEALIPPLIDFTAAFTVAGLRLSGIPVLQEGNYLTLSNSQWSVVEACSGLRYLIACITVGVLFAYLSYRTWLRRALFLLASIIVPIIANGFRAYLIVLLGYASDMRLAVGVDHLIYGWVFFGIVMMLLFWVGSFFRDIPSDSTPDEGTTVARTDSPVSPRAFVLMTVALVLATSIWPAWAVYAHRSPGNALDLALKLPASIGSWQGRSPRVGWQPRFVGADATTSREYEHGADWAGTHVAYYRYQAQGAELVSSSNSLAGPDDAWRQLNDARRTIDFSGERLAVREVLLGSGREQIRAWGWYWIAGARTTSESWAKVLEAKGKLLGNPPAAAGVTIYTQATNDEAADRARLKAFLDTAVVAIEAELSSLSENR